MSILLRRRHALLNTGPVNLWDNSLVTTDFTAGYAELHGDDTYSVARDSGSAFGIIQVQTANNLFEVGAEYQFTIEMVSYLGQHPNAGSGFFAEWGAGPTEIGRANSTTVGETLIWTSTATNAGMRFRNIGNGHSVSFKIISVVRT